MKKILVIEDEPQVRASLQEILELNDYEVALAKDGQFGLQAAVHEKPDLIICDVMLPGLTGFELLEALREQSETAFIPFIFLTARSDNLDMRQGMALKADDYITKPFDPSELLRSISARLEKHDRLMRHYTSKLEETVVQLNRVVNHDALTGLPNSLYLQEHFKRLQGRSRLAKLALLLIELGQFDEFRSSLGLTFSNFLLKAIANRLSQVHQAQGEQQDGLVAYLGGSQFVVLLKATSPEDVAEFRQKLLDTINHPYDISNHHVTLTAEVSDVTWLSAHTDLDTVLGQAEEQVRKQQRALGVVQQTSEVSSTSSAYLGSAPSDLARDLDRAIQQGELTIVYQPQVNLKSGQMSGSEALLRWQHPQYGNIAPAQFIPIAEESNLIIPLGEWTLASVCAQVKQWQSLGLPLLPVAVNLSAKQFKQANLSRRIISIIESCQFDPMFLELEITENLVIQDIEMTIHHLNQLRELGISISVDDFGTGYSSLMYLQQLPLNTLKIDQCFVRNIDHNPANMAIVQAIIQMARSLNLSTIAEGVETSRELMVLKKLHCDSMQGYLYSQPISHKDFEALLRAHPLMSVEPKEVLNSGSV